MDMDFEGVSLRKLYASAEFGELYSYGGELGALYTKEATDFRVWSPVSRRVTLNIYDCGLDGPPADTYEMTKSEKGVFGFVLPGNQAGKFYTYTVYNGKYPAGREIVDPYAKSAGTSGLRGQVIDFSETDPDGWEKVAPIAYDRRELVVWETHVADVTASKTWTGTEEYRGRFLGMCESGTTYTENGITVKTGFDHIAELGVNAVQLLPVFDQANDENDPAYNWGYNPLNYNVPEGGYSTDPSDGRTRIKELKQLVAAFNAVSVNVIMDVVYNHVNVAEGSNFDVLMPEYYFRYTENGELSNGSGCGNETAAENPMFRKFIIDSVCFLAKEYKLGGFRFDLMGLHDLETMRLLAEKLREINPAVVIYGEPWTGGFSALDKERRAVQKNIPRLKEVGQFNDKLRDALIRGGMNSDARAGWVMETGRADSEDLARIAHGLLGETYSCGEALVGAEQTVNYVSCHDNYTLCDRFRAAGIADDRTAEKMALLANAVVLTSDGTSLLLAGEELLRSKGGCKNSYNAGFEVNGLDYALKIRHPDLFEAYRRLIAFKKSLAALLPYGAKAAVHTEVLAGGAAILMEFKAASDGGKCRVVHANGAVDGLVMDFSGYDLQFSSLPCKLSSETRIEPYQTVIACTKD